MKGLCGNSWTAAHGAHCSAPSDRKTRRRAHGFVCHFETAERNPASVQKVCHGFAKPKGSKITKPAQNRETDLFRCFIQQLLNRNKMLMYLRGLGFNTSQVILKSLSQLCQLLEVFLFSLYRWRTEWDLSTRPSDTGKAEPLLLSISLNSEPCLPCSPSSSPPQLLLTHGTKATRVWNSERKAQAG